PPVPDVTPRGKEAEVVHEIVEQIHEEKFSEPKNYGQIG
uniref:Uncharacterized protein n=1 Tax=Caenorhabditis japonica TaxID=281687 RepID=A0A8R1ITC2_CAEJA